MRKQASILFKCIRILTLEQLREPIAVFWSLVAPVTFLALSAYHDGGFLLGENEWIDKIGIGLAYVAITMSLFSFGMFLIGRRESGFVRSFLTCQRKRFRFVLMQYTASYIVLLGYGAIYALISAILVNGTTWQAFLCMYGRFALFSAVMMFGTICIAALPLTFQSAGSVMSMLLTIIVVAGLAINSTSTVNALTYVNPFNSAAAFISDGISDSNLGLVMTIQLPVLVALGFIGLFWQRINPEWSNR